MIPRHPRCVGIITSKTSVALRDMLHVLKRRNPSLSIIIDPVIVQWEDAPKQIVSSISLSNSRKECDVLIIGHGERKREDLCIFNNEDVVRVIVSSTIPIISAVEHETDITIADFSADLRVSTTAVSAEVVSLNRKELIIQVLNTQKRLKSAIDYFMSNYHDRLTKFRSRLQKHHPQLYLVHQRVSLEKLYRRMYLILDYQIKRFALNQGRNIRHLRYQDLQSRIWNAKIFVQNLQCRLSENIRRKINIIRERLGKTVMHLEVISPLSTLARGYSIVTTNSSTVLKQSQKAEIGKNLTTHLKDGCIESELKPIQSDTKFYSSNTS